jgi:cell division protein FtsI/penicillin-binding protein 2
MPASVGTLELPYNDLEFARAAAGFQGSALSPIGAAHISVAIARGGEPLRLKLSSSGLANDPPSPALPRIMSAATARRLARMMEVTIHSGTCRLAFSNEEGKSYLGNIGVAGKTGTLRPESASSTPSTTSWFLGFAPSRAPEVAVAVMLQNGEVWRRKANEVARDLLRCYFAGRPHVTDPFAKPAPVSDPSTTALR